MDYTQDTIESKLNNFKGEDISEFLENQIEYFLRKRASSKGEKRDHYQKQLNITGKALSIHKTGAI